MPLSFKILDANRKIIFPFGSFEAVYSFKFITDVVFKCKFFLAGGPNDEGLIEKVLNSSIGKNCISFSKMSISQTMPIIAACKYCISNDTGFGHLSAGLGCKTIMLFIDSPPAAYGIWNKNISIVVPENKTIETTTHDTMGTISTDKVLKKALEFIN